MRRDWRVSLQSTPSALGLRLVLWDTVVATLVGTTLLLSVLASSAQAAGLGALRIQSPLGAYLRGDIEITQLTADEEATLTIRLPSAEMYRQQGLDYTPAHSSLRVALARDGRPVAALTSTAPMNEPLIDVLLELKWAGGHLMRQYTVLLDPLEQRLGGATPSVSLATGQSLLPITPSPAASAGSTAAQQVALSASAKPSSLPPSSVAKQVFTPKQVAKPVDTPSGLVQAKPSKRERLKAAQAEQGKNVAVSNPTLQPAQLISSSGLRLSLDLGSLAGLAATTEAPASVLSPEALAESKKLQARLKKQAIDVKLDRPAGDRLSVGGSVSLRAQAGVTDVAGGQNTASASDTAKNNAVQIDALRSLLSLKPLTQAAPAAGAAPSAAAQPSPLAASSSELKPALSAIPMPVAPANPMSTAPVAPATPAVITALPEPSFLDSMVDFVRAEWKLLLAGLLAIAGGATYLWSVKRSQIAREGSHFSDTANRAGVDASGNMLEAVPAAKREPNPLERSQTAIEHDHDAFLKTDLHTFAETALSGEDALGANTQKLASSALLKVMMMYADRDQIDKATEIHDEILANNPEGSALTLRAQAILHQMLARQAQAKPPESSAATLSSESQILSQTFSQTLIQTSSETNSKSISKNVSQRVAKPSKASEAASARSDFAGDPLASAFPSTSIGAVVLRQDSSARGAKVAPQLRPTSAAVMGKKQAPLKQSPLTQSFPKFSVSKDPSSDLAASAANHILDDARANSPRTTIEFDTQTPSQPISTLTPATPAAKALNAAGDGALEFKLTTTNYGLPALETHFRALEQQSSFILPATPPRAEHSKADKISLAKAYLEIGDEQAAVEILDALGMSVNDL